MGNFPVDLKKDTILQVEEVSELAYEIWSCVDIVLDQIEKKTET